MVSARACAHQSLPYNSSSINVFGKKTVQADSCLHSEQIDTLLLVWGYQKGVLGVLGGAFRTGGQNSDLCQERFPAHGLVFVLKWCPRISQRPGRWVQQKT
jgi:hypothetical protein